MLDKGERDALREIERRISAADPDLAALLGGERRLVRDIGRTCQRALLAFLALLIVPLLALGLPAGALVVAAVAGALWLAWGYRVPRPGWTRRPGPR